MGVLLNEGIGDTIRVSLTPRPGGDRRDEVYAACELLQALGLRSFSPSVTACPGCGRTTSSTFQELAERTQDYIRERMPEWKTQYEGVETMTLAVMGCVVNGPGESKAANIGISLPGTGEAPNCPVYIDGRHVTTLRGTTRSSPRRSDSSSTITSRDSTRKGGCPFPRFRRGGPPLSRKGGRPLHPDGQQRQATDHQSDRQAPPEANHPRPGAEAQQIAERQADHPVADEIPDHGCPGVGQSAQRAGRDPLQTVEQLEQRGHKQQRDAGIDHVRDRG